MVWVIIIILVIAGLWWWFSRPVAQSEVPLEPLAPVDTSGTDNAFQTAPASGEVRMDIKGFAYSQPNLTVEKGTTVVWTNQDDVGHTVTGDNGGSSSPSLGGPASDLLALSDSYSYTFNEVGTFPYHCQPHPQMTGTVTVVETVAQ